MAVARANHQRRVTWGWASVSDFFAWMLGIGIILWSVGRSGKIDPTLLPVIGGCLGWVPWRRGIESLKRRAERAAHDDEDVT